MISHGQTGYVADQRDAADLSILPLNKRWGYFPAVSLGWTVSNEKFFKNWKQNVISNLKIRASWGKLGNQEIGNYAYTPTMGAYYNYYFGNEKMIGMAEDIVANDDIKWETTTITDLGLDAAFWNQKINVTFDYFNCSQGFHFGGLRF